MWPFGKIRLLINKQQPKERERNTRSLCVKRQGKDTQHYTKVGGGNALGARYQWYTNYAIVENQERSVHGGRLVLMR